MKKIVVLSPVHVATGNLIESPSYKITGTIANRYRFIDLLSQLSAEICLNQQILNELQSSPKSRKFLYESVFKKVNYNHAVPRYSLRCDFSHDRYNYDVSEQIKDKNIPYIPGSTIKGFLMNAWLYDLLKKNYGTIENKLERFLNDCREYKKTLPIMDLLFDFNSKNEENEFMKDICSCLLCQDLYFNKLELFKADRIGSEENREESMPLTNKECLSPNQSIESELFTIDVYCKERIQKKYGHYQTALNIIHELNESTVLQACNTFTADMLMADTNDIENLYYDYPDIKQQISNIQRLLSENEKNNAHHFILRVGNSTNYFFKSISMLIKKNAPSLYKEYFDAVFSPSTYMKTKAKSESLPKTRVVFSNNSHDYLPGFIEVSYDKKS